MNSHPHSAGTVAVLGYGAIGELVIDCLASHGAPLALVAVLERDTHLEAVSARLKGQSRGNPLMTSELDALLACRPSLVVECAGPQALRAYGAKILRAGVDLLIASIGALAYADLDQELREAANEGGARLLLPSGAIGGLDVLASARVAGLQAVEYSSNKPISGWLGTHAETLVDLKALREPTLFFSGNAREAAQRFPQNANVAAAVALAGVGFEDTAVRLYADPSATGNRHRVRAHGAFGSIDVTVEGYPLAANPKSSILAPMSIAKAVLEYRRAVSFA